MPNFSADSLRRTATLLFQAAGTPEATARQVADSLIDSNLRGHDSHGIAQVTGYVRKIQAGSLKPDATPIVLNESPTSALVDGQWGFGQVTAAYAMDVLVKKAQAAGMAAVGIRNCNHIGRLGLYAEQAAAADVLSMVTLCGGGLGTSTTPYGGAGRSLGSNPFAFGLPAGEQPPVIVDFATTVVAGGKIAGAREKNQSIPPGWIVDAAGRPTTDPNEFGKGGMLLTMAEHKGFGLSMVAEAFGGALTGATQFAAGESGRNCVFMWGIRSDIFQPAAEYERLEARAIEKIKQTPPAPGFDEVLIPGERGRKTQAERIEAGIWLPDKTWGALQSLAAELGIAEQLPTGNV